LSLANSSLSMTMSFGSALLVLLSLFSVACCAQSPAARGARQSVPIAYLNRALDQMQANALRRNTVNWPQVRAAALSRAAGADSTVGTYDAIRFALASLGDHHSSLHLTPELEALEAQYKANHPTDVTPAPSRENFSPYVGRYEPEGQLERRGDKVFGFVVLTKCFPENDREFVAFETRVQKILAELDQSHPAGWIVDLRGNVGGNMWPMLGGIGPLLGEGDDLGEFFNVKEHATWQYRNGVAAELDDGKAEPYPAVEGRPYRIQGTPNAAVLIDRSTGSSGEAIAVAFRGRPHTRFFGEHTQGSSTVNQGITLSDGAQLWLTVGVQADRNGKQYTEGLAPDEALPSASTALPPAQDPVVQAALNWLSSAPASEAGVQQ
jgi:carboxyl-terminal processing protease